MNTSVIRDSLKYLRYNYETISKTSLFVHELQMHAMYSDKKLQTALIKEDEKTFNALSQICDKESLKELFIKHIVTKAKEEIKRQGMIVTKDDYLDAVIFVSSRCKYTKKQLEMLINTNVHSYDYFINEESLIPNLQAYHLISSVCSSSESESEDSYIYHL